VISVPAGTTAGVWYLIAKADALDTVPETIETNNHVVRTIVVSTP